MTKPRYQHIITLDEKDEKVLQAIRRKGIKVIEIFKAGLYKSFK